MASVYPDAAKGWELPIYQSSWDTKEYLEDLLSKFRRVHSSVCARNSYLEGELLRISANPFSFVRSDFTKLPVPREWASSAEVRTLIGRLEKQQEQINGEFLTAVAPQESAKKFNGELAISAAPQQHVKHINGDLLTVPDPPHSRGMEHGSDQTLELGKASQTSNGEGTQSENIHRESIASKQSLASSVQFRDEDKDEEPTQRTASFAADLESPTDSPRQGRLSSDSSASERKKRQSQWKVAQGSTKDFRSSFARPRVTITKETTTWMGFLGWVVNHNYFIAANSLILFSYAIFVAIETEILALNPDEKSSALTVCHVFYCLVFTVELLLRLGAEGWSYFIGKQWLFNWFDTCLVISNVVDLILEIWSASLTGVASAGPIMRTLRTMRIVRTIRLVRTFRHFHEFQKMAFAIASSFKTLLCSMLVVFFLMFFFAVVFTQGAADLALRASIMDLDLRYGDFPATLYTLFLSISSGISWDSAYVPLAELSAWYGYAFILYIIISSFGVLNVVTSIFVESVVRSAQLHREIIVQDKEKEKWVALEHMQEVFRLVNRDGSGQVTSDEVEYFLGQPELRKYMEALDVSPEDTRLLFKLLDRDGSGTIDIDEFCEGCLRLKGNARSIDMQTLIFQMKNFLSKWAEFTDYVEERFDQLQTQSEAP